MKTSASWRLIVLGFFAGPCAFAQDAPPCSSAGVPVVVRDFTAVSQGGESRLPGSRLRSMRNTMKVDQNASALAEDIVKTLQARGVNACRAQSQGPLPASGWLVTGEFDESIPAGPGAALPSMNSSDTPPNTHVTVQLASLSAPAGQASARIDTSDELKGQKSAAAPKPYGAAARFVINKVEGASSLHDLAGKIADGIVTEQKRLGSEP
ncbi:MULTISPECIES: hypothetical protein [unclassified Caballeronia]|uniref:hypothetical protein n=1 Tax=unclassified Caballeronia TaxID=2646786 RepID=UPI002861D532|nr:MULTISPECIES: hypothetical protein [unclassified Caballeronia]MDR5817104.1 hypothetical protein [Caballeronia sp. LZ033]MDR5881907.1 hypothetical protein [Caballeronia sp. LZ032]